jgi:transcriptional regulator with XRE-family HTH domain
VIPGDLAAFLRSRRAAVAPRDVGLPAGPRRRTGGLRRAELATLAGISVDYLIRLEQGRDTNPSARVLVALADALRLGEDDRDLLRRFAVVSGSAELCPSARPAARTVRPSVRAILAQLEPAPAYVTNHVGDLLAWTDGYRRLAGPLGVLDTPQPNLLWFVFDDERAREVFPDWSAVADAQVAELVAACGPPGDEARELADRLGEAAGPEFTDRWTRMAGRVADVQLLAHPAVGRLRLGYEVLDLPDRDRQRLVVQLPADPATSEALLRLASPLRPVPALG